LSFYLHATSIFLELQKYYVFLLNLNLVLQFNMSYSVSTGQYTS
jgi:hypothetical protein